MIANADSPAKRIAAARADAAAADIADAKASKTLLDRLLRQPVETRFAAFEDEAKKLTPADRRALLASIKNAKAPKRIALAGGTASRIAIWRSQLPYRVGGIAVGAVAGVLVVAAMIVAARNTPSHAVMIVTNDPIVAEFKSPDGRIVADRLEPKTRYIVVSERGGKTTLRLWVAQLGYATATVPSDWLRPASPPSPAAGRAAATR